MAERARKQGAALSEAQKEQIRALSRDGRLKLKEIAALVGCSPTAVHYHNDANYAARRLQQIRRNRELRLERLRGSDHRLEENRVQRAGALYDPKRDGPAQYDTITAALCGDPPVGRQALLRDWEARNPDKLKGRIYSPALGGYRLNTDGPAGVDEDAS
jgi:hypothetical protein